MALSAGKYSLLSPDLIISDNVTMKMPAGTFKICIRVEETSRIGPGEKCYKIYAPGLGLIQNEDLLLAGYSKPIQ